MILFEPHDNDWLKNKFHYYQQLRQQKNLYFSEKYKMFVDPEEHTSERVYGRAHV